jgi:hypothetical protein
VAALSAHAVDDVPESLDNGRVVFRGRIAAQAFEHGRRPVTVGRRTDEVIVGVRDLDDATGQRRRR